MSREKALVDASWVEANRNDPKVVLVEVDEDVSAYDKGHIPGAVRLDWKSELQDPVIRDFINREQFEKLLSEKGISNDDIVVLYGGNNNWFAAYAYWYFSLYGHADVRLLDGGRKKWELDSRELTTEATPRQPTSYTAPEPRTDIRAFR
ncbi:sulfurtransferase, partial [Frankia casuarinae]